MASTLERVGMQGVISSFTKKQIRSTLLKKGIKVAGSAGQEGYTERWQTIIEIAGRERISPLEVWTNINENPDSPWAVEV